MKVRSPDSARLDGHCASLQLTPEYARVISEGQEQCRRAPPRRLSHGTYLYDGDPEKTLRQDPRGELGWAPEALHESPRTLQIDRGVASDLEGVLDGVPGIDELLEAPPTHAQRLRRLEYLPVAVGLHTS
jgi:hypothetical protein